MKGKLALHTCCAPCATYVNRFFAEQGFEVVNVFYNPNIHPVDEYERRRVTLEEYIARVGGTLCTPFPYDPREFFALSPDLAKRCSLCYSLRLWRVALWAKERGFSAFSTTLTISPYQDVAALLEAGERIGKEAGIPFVGVDFRPHFPESVRIAKELGLYRQKYCGCIMSYWEGVKKRIWKSRTGQKSSSS
ncbi:MAG: epoxyqueuosine reductase QueH [Candidatus Caldatribacterium sp.]|nr:epoxyqueuosine reductase QueH [Candidatus Caldatribacterium sp.]